VSPWQLLTQVVAPLAAIAGVGAFIEWRGLFKVSDLTRLTVAVLTPSLLFSRLSSAHVGITRLLAVVAVAIPPILAIAAVLHVLIGVSLLRLKVISDLDRRLAVVVAVVPNSGNFGLPLAQALGRLAEHAGPGSPLAGLSPGNILATQTSLLVAGNILLWVAAPLYLRSLTGAGAPSGYLRFVPAVGALVLAVTVSATGIVVPAAVRLPIGMLGDACVPVLLLALGGILVSLRHHAVGGARWLVAAATTVKLLLVPAVVWVWSRWLGQWPEPGYQLVLATAAPTAVLTSQLHSDDMGASSVAESTILWSTILSVATLSIISVMIR
jgi:malonate transporter and related proteins